MKMAYLDNSSTTPVYPNAAKKALEMMTETYGNPSSLHSLGFLAEQEMQKARKILSSLLHTEPETIYFTSGGTESNNLALIGACESQKRKGNHVILSAIEHPSVLNVGKKLEELGYEVEYILPKPDGSILPEDVQKACRKDTILISIMMVNNETGAIFPWETFAKKIKKEFPSILLHSDAVQAFGKISISLQKTPLDLLSCSGHKIGAPKGIGALYVRKGVRLKPLSALGGGQEQGLRSGTENVPGISAFGEAIQCLPSIEDQTSLYSELSNYLIEKLKTLPNVRLHLPNTRAPYIVHLSICGIKSETLVHFLASKNIFVSGGSACAKGNRSHVLTAMGLDNKEIDSSLRISLSPQNTLEDIRLFISAIQEAQSSLVHSN